MLRVRSVMSGVAGTPWYVNHYFTNADDQAGAEAAVAAVAAFWAVLDGLQANEVTGEVEALVTQMSPSTGDVTGVYTTAGAVWQGDSAAKLLPPATQGLVQYRTGFYANGREVRGKTFIPGLTEDNLETDGTPGATSIAAFLLAGQALVDAAPSFCVYSPTNGAAPVVINVTAPNYFGSLRSRRD